LEVELDITDLDTTVLRIVEDLVVEVGIVEERLGRNAADIETGAAKGTAFFNTGDL